MYYLNFIKCVLKCLTFKLFSFVGFSLFMPHLWCSSLSYFSLVIGKAFYFKSFKVSEALQQKV